MRSTHVAALRLAFGKEIATEILQGDSSLESAERSRKRADIIWQMVKDSYRLLVGEKHRPHTPLPKIDVA